VKQIYTGILEKNNLSAYKKLSIGQTAYNNRLFIFTNNPVGKIAEKAVGRSAFLLIRHSKDSAKLSKIHSYRLLFTRFAHWGNSLPYPTKYISL